MQVLQKGISGVKSMLSGYRERLVDVMTDCEKTANQIDSIGDELKQIREQRFQRGQAVSRERHERGIGRKAGCRSDKGSQHACKKGGGEPSEED